MARVMIVDTPRACGLACAGIKVVKLSGWEDRFHQRIEAVRTKERRVARSSSAVMGVTSLAGVRSFSFVSGVEAGYVSAPLD